MNGRSTSRMRPFIRQPWFISQYYTNSPSLYLSKCCGACRPGSMSSKKGEFSLSPEDGIAIVIRKTVDSKDERNLLDRTAIAKEPIKEMTCLVRVDSFLEMGITMSHRPLCGSLILCRAPV